MDEEEIKGLLIEINAFLDFPEYHKLIGRSTVEYVASVEEDFKKNGRISVSQLEELKKIYEIIQMKICD